MSDSRWTDVDKDIDNALLHLIECMRMRHRVRHSEYDEFIPTKAEPAVDAARRIISCLRETVAQFKAKIDPDPDNNDDGD